MHAEHVALVTVHYRDAADARHDELDECLRRNAAHELIDEVHVFNEDEARTCDLPSVVDPAHRHKLRVVERGDRLDFATLFAHANDVLPRRRVAVANGDIWFDSTLSLVADVDLSSTMLCLSRWDDEPDGRSTHFDTPSSQDVWIFDTPLPRFPLGLDLGVPGCDNRLAWEAERVGLTIANPSRSIRAHHLHLSDVRHYSAARVVPGPYRYLPATALPLHQEAS